MDITIMDTETFMDLVVFVEDVTGSGHYYYYFFYR